MITSLVYICYAISIVCLTFTIYNIYCYFTVNKANARFNIYKMLLNKINSHKSLKSKVGNTIRSIILNITPYAILLSIIAFIIGSGVNMINTQISAVIALTQTVLSKDDDCPCYALCTGDKKIDEKSVYELLFGSNEYKKLVNSMELKENEKAEFDAINKGKDGKAKSDFIKEHINEAMVNNYKSIVGNNKNFRPEDGLDRTTMTQDELTKDLEKLLSDYKINGRNPNCECKTVSSMFLKNKCLGVKHYVEGWSWKTLWEPDKGLFGNTSNSSTSGKTGTLTGQATGQYAIKLDDGTYYWYHQGSDTCDYNVIHPTYGRYSEIRLGGPTYGEAWRRGCSSYATALAISNVLGQEVTPFDVLLNVFKGSINSCTSGYYFANGSGGTSTTGVQYADQVYSNKAVWASLVETAYGSQGIKAKSINETNQSELDDILNKGGMVVFSVENASNFPWYKGSAHFIAIRKKDKNGKYYCLNSSCSVTAYGTDGHTRAINCMNDGITWDQLRAGMRGQGGVGIWKEVEQSSTAGTTGTTIIADEQVLNKLKNSGYASKAEPLAYVYKLIGDKYGTDAAIGVMANIWHEGSPGLVQYGKTVNNWDGNGVPRKSTTSNPAIVRTANNVNAVEALGSGSNDVGVGMIQWTYFKYMPVLANYYRSYCTVEPYSNSELLAAEMGYLMEMADSSGNVLNGNYIEVCTQWLLVIEQPSEKESKIPGRCATAEDLHTLLTN